MPSWEQPDTEIFQKRGSRPAHFISRRVLQMRRVSKGIHGLSYIRRPRTVITPYDLNPNDPQYQPGPVVIYYLEKDELEKYLSALRARRRATAAA